MLVAEIVGRQIELATVRYLGFIAVADEVRREAPPSWRGCASLA